MERAKWYVVLRKGGMSALHTIEGIRIEGRQVLGGLIIPGLWFRDIGDSDFESLFVKGYRSIEAYNPSAEELPILFSLYPAMAPKTLKPVGNGAGSLQNKWYRVASHVQVAWGVAALCTVAGVCKAGDVAYEGDVVPAQWFSGLSKEQLSRLERTGARSDVWFDAQDAEYRAKNGFLPPILRYGPNPIELLSLYEQFPGANPNAAVVSVETAPSNEETEGGAS